MPLPLTLPEDYNVDLDDGSNKKRLTKSKKTKKLSKTTNLKKSITSTNQQVNLSKTENFEKVTNFEKPTNLNRTLSLDKSNGSSKNKSLNRTVSSEKPEVLNNTTRSDISTNSSTTFTSGLKKRYETIRKIGSGNFGCAFMVKDNKKSVSKSEMYKVMKQVCVGPIDPGETVDAMQEAKLLSRMKHSSIVQFFESFLDGQFFCIVLEYCEGGDLEDAIKNQKEIGTYFEESQIVSWYEQLLGGIEYMHGRRVLHRDLKTRNIFLRNNEIKIGDFGISRILLGTYDKASTFVGTPYYMSPEVLNHEDYDEKCDIWSLGVVLYRICCHEYPFDGTSLMTIMLKIVSGVSPALNDKYSRALNNLLERMFDRKPENRPKAKEILQHRLFNNRRRTSSSTSQISNLTARDRLRLKKQKEADEKIEKLKKLAFEKRIDNERIRRESKNKHLKTKTSEEEREEEKEEKSIVQDRTITSDSPSSNHVTNGERTYVADLYQTVRGGAKSDDLIIPSTSSSLGDGSGGDEELISNDDIIESLIRDGVIPEDEELANTLYSLHDDFEEDDDDGDDLIASDDDQHVVEEDLSMSWEYGEMLDCMEEALVMPDETFTSTRGDINRSESSELSSSPPQQQAMSTLGGRIADERIEKMREKCLQQLGAEVFYRAYDCLSRMRFDEEYNEEIMRELTSIVPDTSKCMQLEQLVFLEQQRGSSSSSSGSGGGDGGGMR